MSVLTLQPDGTAGKDNWIQSDSTSANNGTDVQFQAIQTGGSQPRRGLLEFDITSIPASSNVSSAILSLWVETVVTNDTLAIHRVTQAWTETGSTWNKYNGTDNWASAGGDFAVTASATFTAGLVDEAEVQVDITSLVQEWVNGTANNGMIVKMDSESGASKGGIFHSSDSATAGKRPKLVVTYTERSSVIQYNFM